MAQHTCSLTASLKCSLLRKTASFALPTRPDGTDLPHGFTFSAPSQQTTFSTGRTRAGLSLQGRGDRAEGLNDGS